MIGKVITWLLANGATVLGVAQAFVKLVKELLTGVVNIMSLLMPVAAAEASVATLRAIVNVVDGILEKAKGYLLR